MAESFSGKLLVASPLLQDPNFYRTVVFLFEHGEDGAVGTVLNRPSEESASEHVPAWHDLIAVPDVVFVGGPVSNEIAIGVAEFDDDATDAVQPVGIGFVDLTDPPDPDRRPHRIRVFSGYSGWGAGQLEVELAVDSWFIVEATPEDVFGDPAELWSRVLRRQPGRISLYAQFPDDITLN
jgi:putative transcriptional regulator